MSEGHDALEIEAIAAAKNLEMVEGASQIQKRSRPAAAIVTDPPVFDIPGGDAGAGELLRHRPVIRHGAEGGKPTTTMYQHRDGVWAGPFGQQKLAMAGSLGPIRNAHRLPPMKTALVACII